MHSAAILPVNKQLRQGEKMTMRQIPQNGWSCRWHQTASRIPTENKPKEVFLQRQLCLVCLKVRDP
jgi:hypothetical protein